MKFFIEQDVILSALNMVEKFVPLKSPISLLTGIRFMATPDFLSLSATDLDMGIEHKIYALKDDQASSSLEIVQPGSAVFPVKIFSEIIRKIPAGKVSFSCSDGLLNIKAGNLDMTLPYLEAIDFPEISRSELLPSMNFSQKLFKNMIRKTIFARAEEAASRPQLTGVLLKSRGKELHMVALDGFRIAWKREFMDKDAAGEDLSMIIPGKSLMEISRIFRDGDETFTLYSGKNQVEFRTENTVISSRLLEGNFIDYEQVMRVEPKTRVDIDLDSIKSAIDRGLVMAREASKNNLIKFNISKDIFEVRAETEEGSLKEELPCKTEGEDLLIAFNASFMMDALKSIDEPSINMTFSGETGPCIMRPAGSEDQVNFVLPVKMRGDNY